MSNINQGASAGVVGTGKTLGLTNGTYDAGIAAYDPGSYTNNRIYSNRNILGNNVSTSYPSLASGYELSGTLGIVLDEDSSGVVANLPQVTANWIIKY